MNGAIASGGLIPADIKENIGEKAGNMKAEIVNTKEGFLSLRHEWNALLKDSEEDVIHLGHEWMTAWWNNFSAGASLNIVVVYDGGGRLAGIAPFMKTGAIYHGLSAVKITFMANGHSPYGGIIARKGNLEDVVRSVFGFIKKQRGWQVLSLEKLNESGVTFKAFVKVVPEFFRHYGLKDNINSPYVSIDSSWEDFMAGRKRKFKKSLRNKINKAKKAGDITISEVALASSEMDVFMDILRISGKSWKASEGSGDLKTCREIYGFYKEMTDLLGPEGAIKVWILRKAGVPVAFEYHIVYRGVVYPIRADYDMDYSDVSPGSLLEHEALKTLFERPGMKEYNTCGHDYFYLTNWSERTRQYKNIEVFRRGIRPMLTWISEYSIVPVLRKIKRWRLSPSGADRKEIKK